MVEGTDVVLSVLKIVIFPLQTSSPVITVISLVPVFNLDFDGTTIKTLILLLMIDSGKILIIPSMVIWLVLLKLVFVPVIVIILNRGSRPPLLTTDGEMFKLQSPIAEKFPSTAGFWVSSVVPASLLSILMVISAFSLLTIVLDIGPAEALIGKRKMIKKIICLRL